MNSSSKKNTRILKGKSLIFTDLHVGISSDKPSRQKIAEKVIDEIIGRIEMEDIRQVFFLGDLFHQRTAIEVTSLNVANDLVRRLASTCEVFLLQGNHDLYEKYNSVITSLNIFDLDNVNLISVPTEIELNGQKVLLVPWLCGTTLQEHIDRDHLSDKYDVMMGHFSISYSGDIRYKGQRYVDAYKAGAKNLSEVEKDNIVSEILHHTSDFSTIYLGHIHEHESFTFAGRTWNIVGSPQYQVHDMQRLPEEKKQHGYYILDEGNSETFHISVSVPKFVTLYASDMVKGKVSEEQLKGAVVRRCYDIVLSDEQKSEMDKLVEKAKVYEEDSSVFILGAGDAASGIDSSESEMLSSAESVLVIDKFDYIRRQIEKIQHPAIDNSKLLETMKEYYDRALTA